MEVASLKPALEEGASIRPLSDKQYVANEAEQLHLRTEPELNEASLRLPAMGEHSKPCDLLLLRAPHSGTGELAVPVSAELEG